MTLSDRLYEFQIEIVTSTGETKNKIMNLNKTNKIQIMMMIHEATGWHSKSMKLKNGK